MKINITKMKKNEINHNVLTAYRKLATDIYYGKNNLALREQLALFNSNGIGNEIEKITEALFTRNADYFDNFLIQINLSYYPKKLRTETENKESFYTNHFIDKEFSVERLAIFCDMPIQLHIIDILWVLEYGEKLDKDLQNEIFGNRLIQSQNNPSTRALFRPYQKQFQNWWNCALNEAKELLNKEKNVTIINIDLKNFYHRIDFSFAELETELKITKDQSFIHTIFKKIHRQYNQRLAKIDFEGHSEKALPISLHSSYILANWFLKDFDRQIEDKISPVYYSRYVDDMLIVIKDRIIKNSKEIKTKNPNESFVNMYLSDIFIWEKNDQDSKNSIKMKYPKYENLEIQEEKFVIYQFDHKLSPNLIEKFIDDQQSRGYEFSYLSDEADESFSSFDKSTFELNFEDQSVNKARFKMLEDNKFKLSVFLAKLIIRRILNGKNYKVDELEKIERYFKGIYCLKHYYFWEKILTLFMVSEDKGKFKKFINTVAQNIKMLYEETSFKIGEIKQKNKEVQEEMIGTLKSHLSFSINMTLGLNPSFLNSHDKNELIEKNKWLKIEPMHYRETCLLRREYIFNPLIQFTNSKSNKYLNFTKPLNLNRIKVEDLNIDSINNYIPYRIKFYQAAQFEFTKHVIEISMVGKQQCFSQSTVLNNARDLFCKVNFIENWDEIKESYYIKKSKDNIDQYKIGKDQSKGIKAKKGILKIALINKYVDASENYRSLEGNPLINEKRVQVFMSIWDYLSYADNPDMFVFPEICLPHDLIPQYCNEAAKREVGFVGGIEHFNVNNTIYNFLITALPVNIEGEKDLIPFIRLKNNYSPEEQNGIKGYKKYVIPEPTGLYNLFVWKGCYFSTFNCFELANIKTRAQFFGKIDIAIAPVWNPDTKYYSNIVESSVRDLHSYFVLANTSQYGGSRMSRPVNSNRIDKAIVKGGTCESYPLSILISEIKILALRKFQKLTYSGQKDGRRNAEKFKPTPPDFPYDDIITREKNEFFGGAQELKPLFKIEL